MGFEIMAFVSMYRCYIAVGVLLRCGLVAYYFIVHSVYHFQLSPTLYPLLSAFNVMHNVIEVSLSSFKVAWHVYGHWIWLNDAERVSWEEGLGMIGCQFGKGAGISPRANVQISPELLGDKSDAVVRTSTRAYLPTPQSSSITCLQVCFAI